MKKLSEIISTETFEIDGAEFDTDQTMVELGSLYQNCECGRCGACKESLFENYSLYIGELSDINY
jgi:hypothetical protein